VVLVIWWVSVNCLCHLSRYLCCLYSPLPCSFFGRASGFAPCPSLFLLWRLRTLPLLISSLAASHLAPPYFFSGGFAPCFPNVKQASNSSPVSRALPGASSPVGRACFRILSRWSSLLPHPLLSSPLDGGPLLSMAALSSPYQSSPLSLLV